LLRARKSKTWTTNEARRFLESARSENDPFYAAYVLVLVLGMRKGEELGLGCDAVDLDVPELRVEWQLQRVGRRLLRREVKTEAPLSLPYICVAAFKLRRIAQDDDAQEAGKHSNRLCQNSDDLAFSTRYGTPIEPRNFSRSWEYRCGRAGVRRITVHDARRTCATLLVDLDVHPRVIMSVLRHEQIAVTMEGYAQASSAETRDALKRLGESLGE
jgi:integrase